MKKDIKELSLNILKQSYWIHFKELKDLSLYFPPEHEKVKLYTKTIEEIRLKIEKIENEGN